MRRSLYLVMSTSKQGSSECWYCGLLKQFLKDGAGFAEKKWIKDLHLEHTSWHNGETKVYEDVCFLAKDPGSGVISMNTDGAASHAHTLAEGRRAASEKHPRVAPEAAGCSGSREGYFFVQSLS